MILRLADRTTLYQALAMSVTIWLAKWSRESKEEQQRTRYVAVLVVLTLAATSVSLLRAVVTFASLVKVSGGGRFCTRHGISLEAVSMHTTMIGGARLTIVYEALHLRSSALQPTLYLGNSESARPTVAIFRKYSVNTHNTLQRV